MKTPGQVPRLGFYPTAPIQDLPVQVSQIHSVRFPQISTCLFGAPPALSKSTFSMLSFCIAVLRKSLCITDLNKTTLHSPRSLLPGGLQFAGISDRTGSVVPFPYGMFFSTRWWQPSAQSRDQVPLAPRQTTGACTCPSPTLYTVSS